MPRVILDGVTKIFDGPGREPICALSELTFSVEEGECLVLVGPSGSGKTTALRLIAGLEEPTSGTISISGKVTNGVPAKDRDLAMVFQSPALYPHMSAYENLGFGLSLRRWPRPELDARVRDVAELLGLTACLGSKPMALSGGQRQRVAIGRAMVRHAGALLLDEPLANVDPQLRQQLRGEILSLRKRFGTTMIYVTHDHIEAMMTGDRVAVLRDGVLQQVADPLSLYRCPANLFVASFVGSPPMNLFRGALSRRANELFLTISETTAVASVCRAPASCCLRLDASLISRLEHWVNQGIVLGVRSENIGCAPGETGELAPASFRALVSSIERSGPDTYLHADCGGSAFICRVPAALPVTVEQECGFSLDSQGACFFDPVTGKAI